MGKCYPSVEEQQGTEICAVLGPEESNRVVGVV
jgi:hypothetical protein